MTHSTIATISTQEESPRKLTRRDLIESVIAENAEQIKNDPTRADRVLSVGSVQCLCGSCGRYFGGVASFDKHQVLDDDGRVVCLDPASVGLVIVRGDRWGREMPSGAFAKDEPA